MMHKTSLMNYNMQTACHLSLSVSKMIQPEICPKKKTAFLLRGQSVNHRIYLSPPHMSEKERQLLLTAFDSNWIAPLGPHVDAFETELCRFLRAGHAAALSSGTAALHLALIILGAGRGDHVICPSLTFAASANAITYTGAEPVFIDSSCSTWTLDTDLLQSAIGDLLKKGKRPVALMTVDLYGQCAEYNEIKQICREHNIPVIEEAVSMIDCWVIIEKSSSPMAVR